jgi:hypothetical protein
MNAGERTNAAGKPISNKILLSIPDKEYQVIRPYLEFLELPSHLTLHEPSQRVKFVYFPNAGLISLVVPMDDGQTVEAGVVGREGAAGIPIVVGLTRSSVREIVQIATDGFKVEAAVMRSTLKSTPHFQMTLTRYAVVQGMQVEQTAACNRLHHIEKRLARWLLMATMLGTNRPTVSVAAGILQSRKSIEYIHGGVKIVNRKRLEASACECYEVIQQFNGELGIR